MPKRWRIRPHDPHRIESLERSAGVSAVVAQLLICRGIDDPRLAVEFLDARLSGLRDPAELPGVANAAEQIAAAVEAKKRIIIHGDYDVDGMTGAAIMYRCLKLLGADVGYFIPHRVDDGYGLNEKTLHSLKAQGAQLVVTVDCGITSVAPAQVAREIGLSLVITDHHELADSIPAADAVVHPRLPGSNYPFGGLSGAGVAFKLAWAVCQRASRSQRVPDRLREFLMQALIFATLGTVADVAPLIDENRVLVRHGLIGLKERPTLGLDILMQVAGMRQKPWLSAEDVAFGLAPRLNAAGRLGQARLAVELLVTDSEPRARELAEYIDKLNDSRKTLERSIYLAANKQAQEQFDPVNDAALVLAGRGWHPGVIGIVAGRLAERHHRPVVVISLDELAAKPGGGSARSVPGFNLHAALAACSAHLVTHGGHAAAAGLTIDEANLDAFREEFCEYAASEISHEDRMAELHIDAEAPLSAFTLRAVHEIERLAPFGCGNARPLLCATGVELAGPPKKIGGGERHLSLRLSHHGIKMRAVAFGGGEWAEDLQNHQGPLAFAFRPMINTFRGQRSVELEIADWRPANS